MNENVGSAAFLSALGQFCVSSVGMMVGNKLAVNALPLPSTLVIIQAIGTLGLLSLFRSKLDVVKPAIAREWLPVAFLFTLMLFTSLKSFVYVNVSTVLIFRNVGAIITTIVEFFVRGERVNTEVVASELTIVAGAVLYGWGNANFSWIGLFWIVVNVCGQVAYGVLVKSYMDKPHFAVMSKYTMSLYNNLLALPMLLVVLLLQQEQFQLVDRIEAVTLLGWFWIALTCGLGFMISTSGFGLQKLVSATTFLVINNVTKFLNIFLGIMFMEDRIAGLADGFGCIISIAAGFWYSNAHSRMHESRKTAV